VDSLDIDNGEGNLSGFVDQTNEPRNHLNRGTDVLTPIGRRPFWTTKIVLNIDDEETGEIGICFLL
jgi:hypothetical protein